MSLLDVRTYFRAQMDTTGYEEWRDGFNTENIPSTLLDRSYHIESGVITATTSNHQVHEFNCPVTVRVYLKGFLDPVTAIDDAYVVAETILGVLLLPADRLGTCVKDVVPINITVSPLTQQNDNSVIVQLDFEAITFIRF